MRNLKNVHRSVITSPPGHNLTAIAWDAGTDTVICAFGPSRDDPLIQLKRWTHSIESPNSASAEQGALEHIASWDAPCPLPDLESDEILHLCYFPDSSTSCLVLAGGDIVVVRESPQVGEEKIEILGSVDAGISAAAWSPDEELLAITTREDTLLYMTRDFENVANINFSPDDLKASKHVSVGWGKSETQFKGKKTRLLRDPTMPESVDQGVIGEFDAKNTTISWRGDGAYVAVNRIESGRRVILVYSREGILDSASEPVNGLLSALSWRPAGNLIAGAQCLEGRIDIVFFERNGLRHGQFSLRLTKDEVADVAASISLKWNVESSILAVCFQNRIQLWNMGNYHYYLKQEIFSHCLVSNQRPPALSWHTEKPFRLILGAGGELQKLEYTLVVGTCYAVPPEDYGITAVIDGKSLKITPLRTANIPPPMALHEVTLNENAVDVAVSVVALKEPIAFIVTLHQESVVLYEWNLTAKPPVPPSLKWSKEVSLLNYPFKDHAKVMHRQIGFSSDTFLCLLSSHLKGSVLCALNLEDGSIDGVSFLHEEIRGLVSQGTKKISQSAMLLAKNAVVELQIAKDKTFVEHSTSRVSLFSCPSPRVEVAAFQHYPSPESTRLLPSAEGPMLLGLSDNGSLFVNERILAQDCTSFTITPAHLIFTTSKHLLKFVHISLVEGAHPEQIRLALLTSATDLEVPLDTPETDERCRSIERGAKIVTVMPSIFALVLQMPRGNLETIYPRALVLAGIRRSIDRKKYKKAFVACRNHRVDMNILHDHNPREFFTNIEIFVDQLEKIEYIDLFLSQLREEDVTRTMYKEILGEDNEAKKRGKLEDVPKPTLREKLSKTNDICHAFLDVLPKRSSKYFQNIITAHLCKIPPDFDAGLTEISKMQEQAPNQVDHLIEHICFLADVNRLFDNALGIYDLNLTLLIAQQSQKDPREYLPFLQNLQSMDLSRRKYSVDNHLGRFHKALKHLHELQAFEEIKVFVQKHGLYVEALELYRYQEEYLSLIMRLYADHLVDVGEFEEAGIAYEHLHDYPAASEAYRLAHLWRESLSCGTLIPLPQMQLHSLARTLAEVLIESKDFFSAATIHLDYLSDLSTATKIFCKGYYFAEAIRIAGLNQRMDLLETVIDPGLVNGMGSMIELLADCKSQLNAQVPRIRELRLKKVEDPSAFYEGDINEGVDIPDNVSLAPTDATTTNGSLFTRYTNGTGTVGTNATRKTSKNRRREERKRARGKKGSVYEEEYLINSVERLIERINSIRDEVKRLVTGLMRRHMRERARAVETAMVEVVGICQKCSGEIFADDREEAPITGEAVDDNAERAISAEGVLWASKMGGKRREVPTIKGFEKLSLIGT